MDKAQQLRKELQVQAEAYRTLQQAIQGIHRSRQQLTQQQSENEMVLQELKRSDDSTKVYKVIGPALVPQDMFEATSNVEKRLEYIGNEISRLDAQLKSSEDKQAKKRQGIERMQQEFQSLQESIATA